MKRFALLVLSCLIVENCYSSEGGEGAFFKKRQRVDCERDERIVFPEELVTAMDVDGIASNALGVESELANYLLYLSPKTKGCRKVLSEFDLSSSGTYAFLREIIENGLWNKRVIEKIVAVAKVGLKSSNFVERFRALSLLKLLLEKKYGGLDLDACVAAIRIVNDVNERIRFESTEIFKILLERKYTMAYTWSFLVARKGIEDPSADVRMNSFSILKVLAEKDEWMGEIKDDAFFDEIIAVAKRQSYDSDENVRLRATELLSETHKREKVSLADFLNAGQTIEYFEGEL